MTTLATTHAPAGRPIAAGPGLPALHRLLLAAVLAEFIIIRVLLRLGPVAPEGPQWDALFQGLQTVGLAALNLVVLAVLGALAVETAAAVRGPRAGAFAPAPVALGSAAVLSLVGALDAGAWGVLAGALALGVGTALPLALAGPAAPPGWLRALWLAVFLGLAGYHAAGGAAALGAPVTPPAPLYFALEALAVAAGLAVPLALRPRRSVRIAAFTGALVLVWAALALGRPWMLATLVMWNTGFALWLPAPLYMAALAGFLYTVLALAGGDAARRRHALGLMLLGAAGLNLDYAPYALLAVAGCYLIAAAEPRAEERGGPETPSP